MKAQEVFYESQVNEEEEFDIKSWLFRLLRSWYWFAGSLAICLLGAWLFLRYTNPVYQATASVMIKDEKKGGDIAENAVLKELGVNSSKLVENEIEVLKSYDLMEAVVRREQLFVSYLVKGRIRDVAVFGKEIPFVLEILNQDSILSTHTWTIDVDGTKLSVSDNAKVSLSPRYGDLLELEGVRFRFMPNENYAKPSGNAGKISESYFTTIVPVSAATASYSGKLGVGAVNKQASVVSLSINDLHQERGRTVISVLIGIYNNQALDDKNKVTANTIDFLNERLKAVEQDLQGVEGLVQRFKTQHQITDISSDAQQYMEIAKNIDVQRAESQTRLNIISALETDLLINQESPTLVPSTLGIQEVSLASLVEKHNTLVLEKDRAEKNKELGPQNPLLIDLRQQVQETRRTLLANVRNLKEAYKIALNDISRKDEQLKGRIRNIPQIEQKLLEIQRNRNVEEQLYAFLLQKREEAAVTLASNIPDSRTLEKARSLGRVSPKSKIIWIMAGLAGLLVPLLVMLVGDFFNNKVGDASEVQKKMRIPLLGVISHIRKIKSPIVVTERARTVVAEQIRTLRTALGFTGKGSEVKCILVTSFQPGDGKSFVSLNLAASYALLGKKTVLVELDLRKPHIAKYLGITPKQGLTGVLAGKLQANDVLIEIPGYNDQLYLLPAGYLPPNPAELISGKKMNDLLEELKSRFDYVIIDTPPFGPVTDAVLLQRYADVTLVVLRQGHTSKDIFGDSNKRILQNPDTAVYAVLNGVGWRRRYQQGYGYGKYGGYYGYGKSYFEEDDK